MKPTRRSRPIRGRCCSSRSRSARSRSPTTCRGSRAGFKLDGPTIADIFLGKIKTWNDPAIKALNPGMSLPSTLDHVVHRSDSSGTTEGFTKFLADVQPDVEVAVGAGQGRQVADRHRREGQRRRRGGGQADRRARSATSSRRTRSRTGSRTRRSRTSRAPTSCRRSRTRRRRRSGSRSRRTSGSSTINSPNPQAYPIASQTFLDVYTDPCKAGGSAVDRGRV